MSAPCSSARAVLAGLMLSAAAGPALAQTLGQGAAAQTPWWRVAGALLLCLGLALTAALMLKARLSGAPPAFFAPLFAAKPRRLVLVDSLRLSHQIDLCVVHYDGQELLVAASAAGATVLVSGQVSPEPGAPA